MDRYNRITMRRAEAKRRKQEAGLHWRAAKMTRYNRVTPEFHVDDIPEITYEEVIVEPLDTGMIIIDEEATQETGDDGRTQEKAVGTRSKKGGSPKTKEVV